MYGRIPNCSCERTSLHKISIGFCLVRFVTSQSPRNERLLRVGLSRSLGVEGGR